MNYMNSVMLLHYMNYMKSVMFVNTIWTVLCYSYYMNYMNSVMLLYYMNYMSYMNSIMFFRVYELY